MVSRHSACLTTSTPSHRDMVNRHSACLTTSTPPHRDMVNPPTHQMSNLEGRMTVVEELCRSGPALNAAQSSGAANGHAQPSSTSKVKGRSSPSVRGGGQPPLSPLSPAEDTDDSESESPRHSPQPGKLPKRNEGGAASPLSLDNTGRRMELIGNGRAGGPRSLDNTGARA